MTQTSPDADGQVPPPRVKVWADPEIPGPPLYRRDIVDGRHRNLSYGWTWWSARHVVALPAGMTLLDALAHDGPVEVTVIGDVTPIASGLNEIDTRYDTGWSSTKPYQRLIDPSLLCEEVGKNYDTDTGDGEGLGDVADGAEEGGSWGNYFRKMRDIERRELGLRRAVVRSDDYGQRPFYYLAQDWPDGTFAQGGNVQRAARDGSGTIEDLVFIEVFPPEPSTYMRGEGATFEEAEADVWTRWTKVTGCPAVAASGAHTYETRGYRNGAGFCRACNLFSSHVFDLRDIGSVCVVCDEPYVAEVRRRNPDGSWATGASTNASPTSDMVCAAHHHPSEVLRWVDDMDGEWGYLRAIDAHLSAPGDPATPMPDIDWMRHRLPEDLSPATRDTLHESYRHAQRDWLDTLIAERS